MITQRTVAYALPFTRLAENPSAVVGVIEAGTLHLNDPILDVPSEPCRIVKGFLLLTMFQHLLVLVTRLMTGSSCRLPRLTPQVGASRSQGVSRVVHAPTKPDISPSCQREASWWFQWDQWTCLGTGRGNGVRRMGDDSWRR